MKSITVHNLDEKLEIVIREKAKKSGLSLNKTIKALLRKSLGLDKDTEMNYRKDFLEFFNIWSKDDEIEFNKKTETFNTINESEW